MIKDKSNNLKTPEVKDYTTEEDGNDMLDSNAQPVNDDEGRDGGASQTTTTYTTHDGFTTIVSDNDLIQRDVHPPIDITTETMPENNAPHRTWKWERIRFLSLYFLTVTILFSDVNLMAPNLTM